MKQTPISRTIFNLRVKIAVLLSSASERTDHSLQKLADKIMPEVNVNRLHITMAPNEVPVVLKLEVDEGSEPPKRRKSYKTKKED